MSQYIARFIGIVFVIIALAGSACDQSIQESDASLILGLDHIPLAVKDLDAASKIARISRQEEKLLHSYHRPIVLLRKHDRVQIAQSVAPKNPNIGIMLPYTPLHYLLLEHEQVGWVMTSGNTSEEIVRVAEEHCADLIVMGKSTGNILGSDLVGSTARRVPRYTNIPVLIVPNTP